MVRYRYDTPCIIKIESSCEVSCRTIENFLVTMNFYDEKNTGISKPVWSDEGGYKLMFIMKEELNVLISNQELLGIQMEEV